MLQLHAAPGVHRLQHADTNLYLVEQDDRVLVVDAGLPAVWGELTAALTRLGRTPEDVVGVVLTHAHFDHVGTIRRVRHEWDRPVWVHAADERLTRHPYRYAHERARLTYPFRYPAALPALWRMTRAGALAVRGIDDACVLVPHQELLGRPVVLPTPGHTAGHVALHFPDRDALVVGDALVTLDPYTGATGPQIVAGAATADSAEALASLDVLAATGAGVVLPGHGEPWRDGIRNAVDEARRRGAH